MDARCIWLSLALSSGSAGNVAGVVVGHDLTLGKQSRQLHIQIQGVCVCASADRQSKAMYKTIIIFSQKSNRLQKTSLITASAYSHQYNIETILLPKYIPVNLNLIICNHHKHVYHTVLPYAASDVHRKAKVDQGWCDCHHSSYCIVQ